MPVVVYDSKGLEQGFHEEFVAGVCVTLPSMVGALWLCVCVCVVMRVRSLGVWHLTLTSLYTDAKEFLEKIKSQPEVLLPSLAAHLWWRFIERSLTVLTL